MKKIKDNFTKKIQLILSTEFLAFSGHTSSSFLSYYSKYNFVVYTLRIQNSEQTINNSSLDLSCLHSLADHHC